MCRMRHVVYDASRVVTVVCWGLFLLVWTAGAVLVRQRGPSVARRASRDTASVGGAAVVIVVVATPESLWRPLTVGSPWIRLAGLVLLVVATIGTLWARVTLGSMWSSTVVTKEHHALRTSGPYRVVRHPIYAGMLGMMAGTALTHGLGRWAALFVAVAWIVRARIDAEERLLSQELADEYERYRQEVPRLFPTLRPRQPAAAATSETAPSTGGAGRESARSRPGSPPDRGAGSA
jgi:protein-S-isoprenylcysteine O-methyltransferase Ste14